MFKLITLVLSLVTAQFALAESQIRGKVSYIEDERIELGNQAYPIAYGAEVVVGRILEEPISLPAIPVGAEVFIYKASSGEHKGMITKIQMIGPMHLIREAKENLP